MKPQITQFFKLKTERMGRGILMMVGCGMLTISMATAQDKSSALSSAVAQLDQAKSAADYQALENSFLQSPSDGKSAWLPYYYAALCNAKIGFLYQRDGEKIEPFSVQGEDEIHKAISLLDTTTQKNELAEAYVVLAMVCRTKVFINPMTYGRKYGILSSGYLQKAAALAPQNPRVLYLQAWEKYYTPKAWGGDKKKARTIAEAALQQLQDNADGVQPHWGKQDCETLLAQ